MDKKKAQKKQLKADMIEFTQGCRLMLDNMKKFKHKMFRPDACSDLKSATSEINKYMFEVMKELKEDKCKKCLCHYCRNMSKGNCDRCRSCDFGSNRLDKDSGNCESHCYYC